MLRVAVLALLLSAACKDKQPPDASAPSRPRVVDWGACDAALERAASVVPSARAGILLEGCQVCGDWTAILRWNVPHADGGPTRPEIEAAMARCNAFCSGDAKLKFLGTLDDARGSKARAPWRVLAQLCKEEVSAVPDGRFVSATYFALDRIARAAAARGGNTARLSARVELPLPPLTVVGTGFPLPELFMERVSHGPKGDPSMMTPTGGVQITVLGNGIYVGHLPKAKLSAAGVAVDLGPNGYPGRQVAIADLAEVLSGLTAGSKTPVVILAPKAATAAQLVPIIAAAAPVAPIYLAAHPTPGEHERALLAAVGRAMGSAGRETTPDPDEWQIPVAFPIALDADPNGAIRVTPQMTVQELGRELAGRAGRSGERVGVSVH